MSRKTLTSGILLNNENVGIFAHIELENVSLEHDHTVFLKVINWGIDGPFSTPLSPKGNLLSTKVNLPKNTFVQINVDIPVNEHFEVRVTFHDDVIFSVKAATDAATGWLEGYTVLNKEFSEIEKE